MIGKVNISARDIKQRVGDSPLRQSLRLTFFAVVALAASFLLGWLAAEVAVGQLLPVSGQTPTAEQTAGLMLLGLATLLVLVRLDHTCGICHAAQMALAWLQRGSVEENG
jgi:hypothetical protein